MNNYFEGDDGFGSAWWHKIYCFILVQWWLHNIFTPRQQIVTNYFEGDDGLEVHNDQFDGEGAANHCNEFYSQHSSV